MATGGDMGGKKYNKETECSRNTAVGPAGKTRPRVHSSNPCCSNAWDLVWKEVVMRREVGGRAGGRRQREREREWRSRERERGVPGHAGYYFSKAPGTLISCNTQSILINRV